MYNVTSLFDGFLFIKVYIQNIKHQNLIKFCTSKREYFGDRSVIGLILKIYNSIKPCDK